MDPEEAEYTPDALAQVFEQVVDWGEIYTLIKGDKRVVVMPYEEWAQMRADLERLS